MVLGIFEGFEVKISMENTAKVCLRLPGRETTFMKYWIRGFVIMRGRMEGFRQNLGCKHNPVLYRLFMTSILTVAVIFPRPLLGVTPSVTVGVYYFEGWYHDAPGIVAAFANAELRNDFPEREPIWGGGLWRGDTVAIMEQQIDLAADHGIAFFSFDWYWKGSQAATTNDGINSGLKNFMLASNCQRMKFNINIVDVAPTAIGSDAEWQLVADMLLPFLTNSQYLQVGGNPLIINFNAAGMTQTNYNYFQQIAANAGIGQVHFAANVAGSPSLYTHITRYNAVPGWGAGETEFPYLSLTDYVEGNDSWAAGIWNTDTAGLSGQLYIPTVMTGWDARPWNTPPTWYFNPTRTPAAVGAHLQKAIDFLDDNPFLATQEKLIMLFAWNEFGEGGYLAPTLGDPAGLYLDAIKSVLFDNSADLIPAGGDGSVDLFDWRLCANAWQSTSNPPSANWVELCDMSPPGGNGVIDLDDLAVIFAEWLCAIPLPCVNPGDPGCGGPGEGLLIDFEDSPEMTAAPWSYLYNTPQLGTGVGSNTSIVLDPLDFTRIDLDLTHPSVNQAGTKGSVEVDIYYQQGGNRIHLRDNTGWNAAWVNIWFSSGGSNAEISLQTATWTTAFQATDVVVPGTWNTIRIDWDTSTELLSVFLNGSPLPALQNVSAMEPGIPGGWPGVTVTELVLYTWTGTLHTTQFDNIRITRN